MFPQGYQGALQALYKTERAQPAISLLSRLSLTAGALLSGRALAPVYTKTLPVTRHIKAVPGHVGAVPYM